MRSISRRRGSDDWEHWGDGSLNRKAGAAAQLTTYTLVGNGSAFNRTDDLRPISWSDGSPTASSTNNLNAAAISGIGQGFSLVAPADTTTRTLIVHVGGASSGGVLTAHLSDESAADYTNTTSIVAGPYERNYTLTYHSADPGQTLTVTWVMSSGTGNVSVSAAALRTPGDFTPASIQASGGTPQSSPVGTMFAAALKATVRDSGGQPLSGITVTFAAPGSGASGMFGGSTMVTTDVDGVATAPAFTANGVAGGYTVTASVSGVATPANFSLTNTAVSGGGSLAVTAANSTAAVNLTTEGSLDWEHWGDGNLNRKSGVAAQLSNYTVVGTGNPASYGDDQRLVSWTDGTPTSSSSNNRNGVYINGVGQGYTLTAPADTTTRTLILHVGGWSSGGTLTAQLSDGSAAAYQDVTTTSGGSFYRNYTLTYRAANAGQTLTVTWKMTSGSGNVTLNSAALSGTEAPTPANIIASGGTPQSATVNTTFAAALQATVEDSGGQPLSGITVTFAAPGSGASGTFGGSTSVTTNGSGVATAPAFTANGVAGGYTVTASVSGVATPANFNLTNTAVTPASIIASAGTPQSATVNTAFTTALQATVKDSGGQPLSGITVTFAAPGSGASGTFAGSTSVTTNGNGVATAPAFTANGVAGGYTVTASVSGVPTPANFTLTNTPVSSGGSLAGSAVNSTAAVNLTTEGTLDWRHWGDGSLNHKIAVAALLSNYTVVGTGNPASYGDDQRLVSWTDGTPTSSSSNNRNGVYINGVGQGYTLTAPADTGTRTLILHVGGWSSGGTLTAQLSDGSAARIPGCDDHLQRVLLPQLHADLPGGKRRPDSDGDLGDDLRVRQPDVKLGGAERTWSGDAGQHHRQWRHTAKRDGEYGVCDGAAGDGGGLRRTALERYYGDVRGARQRSQRNLRRIHQRDNEWERSGDGSSLHGQRSRGRLHRHGQRVGRGDAGQLQFDQHGGDAGQHHRQWRHTAERDGEYGVCDGIAGDGEGLRRTAVERHYSDVRGTRQRSQRNLRRIHQRDNECERRSDGSGLHGQRSRGRLHGHGQRVGRSDAGQLHPHQYAGLIGWFIGGKRGELDGGGEPDHRRNPGLAALGRRQPESQERACRRY